MELIQLPKRRSYQTCVSDNVPYCFDIVTPTCRSHLFAEITHRFQTARPEVRQLLLQYLLPWLHNMELVDPNVPPANPLSYFQVSTNVVTIDSGLPSAAKDSVFLPLVKVFVGPTCHAKSEQFWHFCSRTSNYVLSK